MKTPISYYGGKQNMSNMIVKMIPEHRVYVEPFFGGGAVFWKKEKSKVEVINDTNGMVINFYHELKNNFADLKRMIDATPYSREAYKRAMVVYDCPYIFEPVVKAWAFWVATNQGFSNKIGSWRSTQTRSKEALLIHNKKVSFDIELSNRLDLVQMDCIDAVQLIEKMDDNDAFFYIDPPYVGSNQGHYGGYMQEHFDTLLKQLSKVEGKFILSCYPNEGMQIMAEKYNWQVIENEMSLCASNKKGKMKSEMLIKNY